MSDQLPTEPKSDHLQLYGMLIDQLKTYSNYFWQFPLALVAANSFAIDKFSAHPIILLFLSLLDAVFVYALHRMVSNQKAIIKAAQKAEVELRKTTAAGYLPDFPSGGLSAPTMLVCALGILTGIFFLYSVLSLVLRYCCHFSC